MTVRIVFLVVPTALVVFSCSSPPAIEKESPETAPVVAQAVAPAAAEFIVAHQHQPSGDVEFLSALDLDQSGNETHPQLRHGWEASSKDWPASLYATFTTPDGTAACTAALIGPQVMLTAAHCVPLSGVVRFKYRGSQSYTTSCTQHPEYINHQDASADYALCKVDRRFAEPTGFLYETVNTSGMASLVNKSITLTGFGCISDVARNSQIDGKYRIGFNTVDETSASAQRRRGAQFYSGQEDNNLFTADDPALANLCPGDSGGPAFSHSGVLTSREIIGVNSRVFYQDSSRASYGSSLISATGGPDFRTWAQEWARNEGVAACGLNGALTKCRN